jgi:[citrate (pro-3S)-lyase] ligase
VEQAAQRCDWLHLFVVKEDASFFRYQRSLALIEQGIAGIANVTLHPGSAYLISRATFPGYFLKDKGVVDDCHSQIDLQLFRERLAPALDNPSLCRQRAAVFADPSLQPAHAPAAGSARRRAAD